MAGADAVAGASSGVTTAPVAMRKGTCAGGRCASRSASSGWDRRRVVAGLGGADGGGVRASIVGGTSGGLALALAGAANAVGRGLGGGLAERSQPSRGVLSTGLSWAFNAVRCGGGIAHAIAALGRWRQALSDRLSMLADENEGGGDSIQPPRPPVAHAAQVQRQRPSAVPRIPEQITTNAVSPGRPKARAGILPAYWQARRAVSAPISPWQPSAFRSAARGGGCGFPSPPAIPARLRP